ncbi:hypothetical protein ACS0TY_019030 [Phlomoides rotata]
MVAAKGRPKSDSRVLESFYTIVKYQYEAVCNSLKLPRPVLRTGAVCSFLAFAAFPLLIEKGYLPVQDDRLKELVVELPPLRIKDLPVISLANKEIATTYQNYELVENMHCNNGRVANIKHPFLWVVCPGLIRGAEWLEPLPENFVEMFDGRGHIVKWTPQFEVLANPSVGVFWTQWMDSTLETSCEGVSMICSPCFTDQLVNLRYVSHIWRVGVRLENVLSREILRQLLKRYWRRKKGEK